MDYVEIILACQMKLIDFYYEVEIDDVGAVNASSQGQRRFSYKVLVSL